VLRALIYFRSLLKRANVRAMTIRTDNMVTMYNLRRQRASRGPLLHATKQIFKILTALDIRIFTEHIPGVQNVLTDALSRMGAAGDYVLSQSVFDGAVQRLRLVPSIDLFANSSSRKLPRFFSPKDHALRRSWRNEVPYAFPPLQLIPRVLQKMRREVSSALIVVPEWPSQPWWNLLWMNAVGDPVRLGQSDAVLTKGAAMDEDSKLPPGHWLMVKLQFD
jgi:hypothetical protein